jgi:hypothetical protein
VVVILMSAANFQMLRNLEADRYTPDAVALVETDCRYSDGQVALDGCQAVEKYLSHQLEKERWELDKQQWNFETDCEGEAMNRGIETYEHVWLR